MVLWSAIELADALVGELDQRRRARAVERLPFGRALHLDEPAVAGLDDVHVDVGARVLVVGEIEQRLAVDDADAGGGDVVGERNRRGCSRRSRIFSSASASATNAAGDRRGARAAVGLDHVAVDPDRPFAERPAAW